MYVWILIGLCVLFSVIALCGETKRTSIKLRRAEKLFLARAKAAVARLPEDLQVQSVSVLRKGICNYRPLRELLELTSALRKVAEGMPNHSRIVARLDFWEEQLTAYASGSRAVSKGTLLRTLSQW